MKAVNIFFLAVLFLLIGCASPYNVTQEVNDLSKELSYKQAVEIVSQSFQLVEGSDGYGLCMGAGGQSGANWLMAATTAHNFKIDKYKAEFTVREAGSYTSEVIRTGIGLAVISGSERHTTAKSIIFKDIDRIDIDRVSWNHVCGLGHDSGYMIKLFETENKVAIVVIKENRLDEFMAAILKLNSNKQLKIYK